MSASLREQAVRSAPGRLLLAAPGGVASLKASREAFRWASTAVHRRRRDNGHAKDDWGLFRELTESPETDRILRKRETNLGGSFWEDEHS